MRPATLLAALLIALAAGAALNGCGGGDDRRAAALEAAKDRMNSAIDDAADCRIPARMPIAGEIALGDSDLSCIQAVATVDTLPPRYRRPRRIPLEGEGVWTCSYFRPGTPVAARCRQGERAFTVER